MVATIAPTCVNLSFTLSNRRNICLIETLDDWLPFSWEVIQVIFGDSFVLLLVNLGTSHYFLQL